MMSKKLLKQNIAMVDIAVLFFGFVDTFYVYIASSYFAEVIGSPNVGFFFFLSYVGSLIIFFCLQPLVRIFGQARTLYLFLLLSLGLAALLSNVGTNYFSGVLLLFFIITSSVLWIIFDILLQGFSDRKHTGSIRGLNLSLLSLGVLLAPFLATQTLESFGFTGVFLVMFILYIFLFIFCLLAFRHVRGNQLPKIAFWHALALVLKNGELWRSYILSFALYFFYAVMIIYMPLYLREFGFTFAEIGSLFTIMLIPFVLLEYPLGKLADVKYGEKEILIISLAIAIMSTVIIALLHTSSFWWWAIILFASRVGIAGMEVMKDTHFYRHISVKDVDVISFFRTSLPVANIVVTALATGMLTFLPLYSIFYLTALVLGFALVAAFFLQDSK